MRIFIVIFSVVFVSSGNGQTIDGFKGYKWGTSFEVMKGRFQLRKDVTSSIQPNRLKGKLIPKTNLIEDACWYYTNISYVDVPTYSMDVEFKFYQNSFCAVRIGTTDDFATLHLLEVWEKAYGEGIKSRTYSEQRIEYYSWLAIGKDSQADLKRLVGGWTTSDGTYMAGYGELTYFSKSIDSLQYRNELEKGK